MKGMVKESMVELETVLSKDFSYLRIGTRCRKGWGKYYNETWETSVVEEKQGN
jgi:hypothetical protein